MPHAEEARNLGVLEYRARARRKLPPFLLWLCGLGPWWIAPSRRTVMRSLPLVACLAVMGFRPPASRLGVTRNLALTTFPPLPCVPLPSRDAVFTGDANRDPILWRPWDNQELVRFQHPSQGNEVA